MRLQHPFEAITPSVDGDCLAVLARADHEFTASRLLPLLGRKRSLSGVRNALDRLADQGVVSVRQVGNVNSYSLNRSHMLAPALIDIATARDRLVSRLAAEMAGWQVKPTFGAMFGSAARGDMHTESDIDVLIVHADDVDIELWSEQVAHFQRQVTSWTGNDTRVLSLTESEVLDHGTEDPVLREITRDGIVLAGPTNWLRRRALGIA
ncbi:nucleotidyltransferase domain-containing protein [Agromyces bracchium]|uniref:Nucleotidyltransferase domain-containing protein n=1 Tax=Agromyces bracchium TaxID=88376 RepID=A0A6I3M381_9MICO|nr:nucleotidyltransferase domain-containing protein [Agromyces bracchium]MTH67298.1 nucleotidyltransferase domain-containing protein [Agromyces bracchium]